jgi:LDH2 family malate/lactate/ureidoglycolate dehydrogenase
MVSNESKKNLMHTINIDNVCDVEEPSMSYEIDFVDNINIDETQKILLDNLDIKARKYFIKMQNGIKITSSEYAYLTEKIKEVLDGQEDN